MKRECDNCKHRDVYYKAPPCNECNGFQNWESDDAMTNSDKNECKVCANADNEYCFACDNGNQFKPMTNADLIRSLSDEKLAEELWAWNQVCCYKWTKDKILKWLKGEAKGGGI